MKRSRERENFCPEIRRFVVVVDEAVVDEAVVESVSGPILLPTSSPTTFVGTATFSSKSLFSVVFPMSFPILL